MLSAGIILSVMVIPFIASVMRDVFEIVPPVLKESAYGIGCTTWEVVRNVVLPYTKVGVIGGIMLGLGRALGETMAVTFVIGNAYRISSSLFEPGNSIASALANEFNEAADPVHRAVADHARPGAVRAHLHRAGLVAAAHRAAGQGRREADVSDRYRGSGKSGRYRRRLLVNRFNLAMSLGDDGLRHDVPAVDSVRCCSLNGFAALNADAVHADDAAARVRTAGCSTRSTAASSWSALRPSSARRSASSPASISPNIGKDGWLARVTRFINDILLSAPSIVIGLFIYTVYVAQVEHFSGWAGSLALALIAIPVVVRTTENMLRLVPNSLREAAIALGAPMWKVILMVTLKAVRGGVITGVLLAVARMSGETAPLLFTALNNQFWSANMNAPMANLPVVIFQFAMSPFEDWKTLAWAGALLITLAVLIINILARTFFRQAAVDDRVIRGGERNEFRSSRDAAGKRRSAGRRRCRRR